jgi:hypothetical protein
VKEIVVTPQRCGYDSNEGINTQTSPRKIPRHMFTDVGFLRTLFSRFSSKCLHTILKVNACCGHKPKRHWQWDTRRGTAIKPEARRSMCGLHGVHVYRKYNVYTAYVKNAKSYAASPIAHTSSWQGDYQPQTTLPFILPASKLPVTERRDRVVDTTASYSGGPGFKSRPWNRLSWGFSWFS